MTDGLFGFPSLNFLRPVEKAPSELLVPEASAIAFNERLPEVYSSMLAMGNLVSRPDQEPVKMTKPVFGTAGLSLKSMLYEQTPQQKIADEALRASAGFTILDSPETDAERRAYLDDLSHDNPEQMSYTQSQAADAAAMAENARRRIAEMGDDYESAITA